MGLNTCGPSCEESSQQHCKRSSWVSVLSRPRRGGRSFVGTIASGRLTDRYDPRNLFAVYYSLRGLSLLLLPFVTYFAGLSIFAVFFGLDYIATVPPTVALAADKLGRLHIGAVFAPTSSGSRSARLYGCLPRRDRLRRFGTIWWRSW